jgi:hypothetical protein
LKHLARGFISESGLEPSLVGTSPKVTADVPVNIEPNPSQQEAQSFAEGHRELLEWRRTPVQIASACKADYSTTLQIAARKTLFFRWMTCPASTESMLSGRHAFDDF